MSDLKSCKKIFGPRPCYHSHKRLSTSQTFALDMENCAIKAMLNTLALSKFDFKIECECEM